MTRLSLLATELVSLHRSHPAVAAMIWLLSFLNAMLMLIPNPLGDGAALLALTALGAVLACLLLTRYEAALKTRISAASEWLVWQVQVNGITLAEVSDSEYAAIRHGVFFDSRIYWSQLANFFWVGVRVVDYLFVALPLSLIWLAAAGYFFAPEDFAQALAAAQKITPAQAVGAIPLLLGIMGVLALLSLMVHFALGRSFGFVNEFDREVKSRLRRELQCAVDGDISLWRYERGVVVYPREFAFLRPAR